MCAVFRQEPCNFLLQDICTSGNDQHFVEGDNTLSGSSISEGFAGPGYQLPLPRQGTDPGIPTPVQ